MNNEEQRARQLTGLMSIYLRGTKGYENGKSYSGFDEALPLVAQCDIGFGPAVEIGRDLTDRVGIVIPPTELAWVMVPCEQGARFGIIMRGEEGKPFLFLTANIVVGYSGLEAFLMFLVSVCEWVVSAKHERPDWVSFSLEKKDEIMMVHMRQVE